MQFKLDFGVLFFCVLSEYTSCREPLMLILSYLPDGWGLVNQDYSGGLWLWSLNWPFFPVNYLNFISLLLFFCHPARLVLQFNHELFENDLWPTANPKSLNFSQADVLLLCCPSDWSCAFLSQLGLCVFGSAPQRHAACFLVSYDPPVTHFLLHSHPATLAPGRQTIHSVPQRLPITHKHTHTELPVYWVHNYPAAPLLTLRAAVIHHRFYEILDVVCITIVQEK